MLQGGCDNCQIHTARSELLQNTLSERDRTISELQRVCSKFETQLSQQDVLLKQFLGNKKAVNRWN